MPIKTITLLDRTPFKCMTTTVGNLPTSFVDSMSYYETLAWLCQYVTETIIPKINEDSEAINVIEKEFVELKKEVEDAIKDIPQLRHDFEALVIRFDETLDELEAQYEAFEAHVEDEITDKVAEVRASIMVVVDAYFQALDDKIDDEVARIDDKFNTWAIANTIVFNSLQGRETTLQVYLDDLAGLNRSNAITATDYDGLELDATTYDGMQISARDYDYDGNSILNP